MMQWPHAPLHKFNEVGTYMVTGATLYKECFFKGAVELDLLQTTLQSLTLHYQWKLEAWAVFANHYHFIAQSPEKLSTLKTLITHFHANTARAINLLHQTSGRKIWHQYWDSQITFHRSYLARLNYVMYNPVKHKIVEDSKDYQWCSANWFQKNASKAYYTTVARMKSDNISVVDDF
ncbi:MAG: transposase [Chlamydiota bacterium]